MMPTFFLIPFVLIFGTIITMIVIAIAQSLKTNRTNNNSPKLTVPAKVVNKRQRVHGDHARTTYYATFEFESGDRIELGLQGAESGMIVEGDQGKLTFQGTRFLGYERI